MSIQNEIVKFIADIELDPQDTAAYQKGLSDCEKSADALRKSIALTQEKMAKLREEGKESSAEFAAHKRSLEADSKALKEVSKTADKYAEALGLGAMSLSQLQKHASSTRSALAKIHKEANPKLWEKYNDELEATNKRIAELKAGGKKTGETFGELNGSLAGGIAAGGLMLKGFEAAAAVGKKIIQDLSTETQKLGDAFAMSAKVAEDTWAHFIRNISASRDEVTLSYREVAELSREVTALTDELFEMENSFRIMGVIREQQLNEAGAIMRDTSQSAAERKKALEEIIELEKQTAADRLMIAEQANVAAFNAFKMQTALEYEEAEKMVVEYLDLKRRGLIDLATEYNNKLQEITGMQNSLAMGTSLTPKQHGEQLERLQDMRKELEACSEEVVNMAEILRQYNLGNDEITTAFVESLANLIEARNAMDEAAFANKYARLLGAINNQLEAEEKAAEKERAAAREESYRNRIAAAEHAYQQELLALKQALAAREISEREYRVKSEAAELAMLNNKIAINQAYGKDIIGLQNSVIDKQISAQKRLTDALAKGDIEFQKNMKQLEAEADREFENMVSVMMAEVEEEIDELLSADPNNPINNLSRLADKARKEPAATRKGKLSQAKSSYDTELTDLESMHELMLISEEEFLARKRQLNKDYAKTIAEINMQTWQDSFSVANQFLDTASEMVSSLRDAELANLDAQMQAELTAAGDNAEEREKIEAEYEAKKLETQKKYADVDMAINIAKTIASGALAAMQSFAQLGPIAGGIMAGVIAATTAAQVATIVAQRNAIKNSSVSSSSPDPSGQTFTREVTGYSEGGYTGNGGRLEPAGIVHRGEYVVAAPELRDPEVAREVARIERKRIARLNGRKALPGYADGGYTDSPTPPSDTDLLAKIYDMLVKIAGTPIPAYIVFSQWQAKQEEWNKHKRLTSLKG